MTLSSAPASAHLLRFGAAMSLLVAIALTSVALEQRSLQLARQYSLQTFRADRLERQIADLRLHIEELQTPKRLMDLSASPKARPVRGRDPADAVGGL